MEVVPPSWLRLPLTQADLGPIFSNSSPFSFSQSFFLLPPLPLGPAPRPSLRASFGPYSVTQVRDQKRSRWSGACPRETHLSDFHLVPLQLMSEAVLQPPAPLAAALLSEHVESEVDERGRRNFVVRALFNKQWSGNHLRGDTGTCVTLHAFRETEERRASCLTEVCAAHYCPSLVAFPSLTFSFIWQPPVSLCVATLTLPEHWFEESLPQWPHQGLEGRSSSNSVLSRRRQVQLRKWRRIRRHQRSVGTTTRAVAHCWHLLS